MRSINTFFNRLRSSRRRSTQARRRAGSTLGNRSLSMEGLERRAVLTSFYAAVAPPDVDAAADFATEEDDDQTLEQAATLKPMFGTHFVWKVQCAANPNSAPCS